MHFLACLCSCLVVLWLCGIWLLLPDFVFCSHFFFQGFISPRSRDVVHAGGGKNGGLWPGKLSSQGMFIRSSQRSPATQKKYAGTHTLCIAALSLLQHSLIKELCWLKKRFYLKDCSACLSFHLTRTVQAQMLRSDPASMASLSSIKMAGQFFYLGKSRNMCDCCVTVFFFF